VTTGRNFLVVVFLVLVAACGGSDGTAPGVAGQAGNAAYEYAYKDAWVKACRAAVADIRRRDTSRRNTKVGCARPQGQQEGNTAFDPQLAREQGRQEGRFDGCAYAWDEAYATSAVDVAPRC
jgi:hypothetical protein